MSPITGRSIHSRLARYLALCGDLRTSYRESEAEQGKNGATHVQAVALFRSFHNTHAEGDSDQPKLPTPEKSRFRKVEY
jgi:hypothetical protein